jgi:hypothetical protein
MESSTILRSARQRALHARCSHVDPLAFATPRSPTLLSARKCMRGRKPQSR